MGNQNINTTMPAEVGRYYGWKTIRASGWKKRANAARAESGKALVKKDRAEAASPVVNARPAGRLPARFGARHGARTLKLTAISKIAFRAGALMYATVRSWICRSAKET